MNNFNHRINLIYVNFAPYENTGNILTYLQNTFGDIAVFIFNFHILAPNQKPSSLNIYHKNILINHQPLYQTPTSEGLAFVLLPIRSLVIFLQILLHTWILTRTSGQIPLFFTVNAFIAWTGNILRKLGLVKKTVFWVWDYYPPQHEKFMVRFMRWMYWLFDKPASLSSNRIVLINKRLEMLRKKIGVIPQKGKYPVVGIGTDPQFVKHPPLLPLKLLFFGVLKKSQGLDLIFDAAPRIKNIQEEIELHIIGGGPDEAYFISRAAKVDLKVHFHGYIPDDIDTDRILSECHIGLAPYIPDPGNVSFYTDPSKIKRYLSLGLPVITTDVFEFSKLISTEKSGVLIDYYKPATLINAIVLIRKNYQEYCHNALRLARKYYYKRIYLDLFGPFLAER